MDINNDYSEIYGLIFYAHSLFENGYSKSDLKFVKKELQKVLNDIIKNEFKEKDNEIMLYFSNIVDFMYYIEREREKLDRDKKTVTWVKVPIYEVCNCLCYISFEEKDMKSLRKYADIIQKYAPMQFQMEFEYLEFKKQNKDLELYKQGILELGSKIYKPNDIAMYYRSLAFYYAENNKYRIGYALSYMSYVFEQSEKALYEMQYCKDGMNVDNVNITWSEIFKLVEDEGIPTFLATESISILENIYLKNNCFDEHLSIKKEFLNILYTLTHKDEYKPFYRFESKAGFSFEVSSDWEAFENRKNDIGTMSEYYFEFHGLPLFSLDITELNKKLGLKDLLKIEKEILLEKGIEILKETNDRYFDMFDVEQLIIKQTKCLTPYYLLTYCIINNYLVCFISLMGPNLDYLEDEVLKVHPVVEGLKSVFDSIELTK